MEQENLIETIEEKLPEFKEFKSKEEREKFIGSLKKFDIRNN